MYIYQDELVKLLSSLSEEETSPTYSSLPDLILFINLCRLVMKHWLQAGLVRQQSHQLFNIASSEELDK